MEKWQKDFFEMLETVADEVERFFQGVSEVVDSVFEISEEITEQVHNTITIEIDQYLNDLADPLLEVYWELEEFVGEAEHSFPYEIEPSPEQNPACIGCHHYHGQVYNGNLLVCAMHPYGWDDKDCPDWEPY
ncbi:hypothetical protein [Gloeocapsopsis dulcis]|uniref:Uncharacterized protein n=1 Tax=Gloeocapsopsis dulcis AAB1 = 1H9 TaxID=1433147 RepID=A0A6N8FYL6_9CHRO|nr:hypothetical protein [Gloeocapsopsis dulcis]MUL37939.1 hypothetical protein [Gloeocapsopsis dulcis AAB1 = 1H9]WNN87335.1 hypothetical protein P0S91_13405 [Gloeocapsopsis dulcis]